MANSRFEYVKSFELDDRLLPGCWIVIRLDGKGFTKFAKDHEFKKPNDDRGLGLMNSCATEVLKTFSDIKLAFGHSDEYSFVVHKSSNLYGRRASKLISLVTSCFSASYAYLWPNYFPATAMQTVPCFDGRAVAYPTDAILRDYLSWRQTDTHINNQYNACFWALVQQGGMTPEEAQGTLKGTQANFKNELLFSRFGVNYSMLPAQHRKGSIVYRQLHAFAVKKIEDGPLVLRERMIPVVVHEDLIGERFWQENPAILA